MKMICLYGQMKHLRILLYQNKNVYVLVIFEIKTKKYKDVFFMIKEFINKKREKGIS